MGASNTDSININNYDNYLNDECHSRFNFRGVSSFEIGNIIKSLESKTSKDPDNLTAKFIKSIGDYIAHPISLLINNSLQTGVFPSNLKIGKIIPIFKKGDDEFLIIIDLYLFCL